jgi:hypothetical protein
MAMTIASADVAGALAEAWQAFREEAATIPAAGTWPLRRPRSNLTGRDHHGHGFPVRCPAGLQALSLLSQRQPADGGQREEIVITRLLAFLSWRPDNLY